MMARITIPRVVSALAFLLAPALAAPPLVPGASTRPARVAADRKVLDTYVGRYRLAPDRVITVTRFRDQLYAQFTDRPSYPVDPEANNGRFTYRHFAGHLTFQKDPTGRVAAVVWEQGTSRGTAPRFSGRPFDDVPVAEMYDSPRIAALTAALKGTGPTTADRDSVLNRFWDEVEDHAPLVEPYPDDPKLSWVTFLYHGDGEKTRSVVVLGGPPPGSDDSRGTSLVRLADTDVWYRTMRMRNDTRTLYVFEVNQPAKLPKDPAAVAEIQRWAEQGDPLNPKWVDALWMAGGHNAVWSILELPDAPAQTYRDRIAGAAQGQVTEHKVASELLKQDRQFAVYAPANLPADAEPPSLLVLFDGTLYRSPYFISAPTIFDNLIAQKKIPPTVVVFIDPVNRLKELMCNEEFARYVAKELVPWVRTHYRVTGDPARTTVGGISGGGLAAAFCALHHPDVFGNVLAQSGAFWYSPGWDWAHPACDLPEGTLANDFLAAPVPTRPTRFHLQAGRFENGVPGNILGETRRLRDVLRAKGYPVTYSEFSGGHQFNAWQGALADALIALAGPVRNE